MATTFTVHGPYRVPFVKKAAAKVITKDKANEFWERHPHHAKDRGCYIFAIGNKGLTPGYVGKATKSFGQEAFALHKLHKYGQFLADYRAGRPVMFFVVAEKKMGKPNGRHIAQAEKYLIQTALRANAELLNIRGTKQPAWSIKGIVRSGTGATSAAAAKLKTSLGM